MSSYCSSQRPTQSSVDCIVVIVVNNCIALLLRSFFGGGLQRTAQGGVVRMGWTCGKYGERKTAHRVLVGKSEERDY